MTTLTLQLTERTGMTTILSPILSGPDAGRRLRWLAYASSGLLLLLAFWAAALAFPFLTGVPAATGRYQTAGAVAGGPLQPGESLMVYDVVGPSKTRRSGAAKARPDGTLDLARYDRLFTPKQVTEAVLMPANIRTLWVMASDAERDELHHAVNAFGAAVGLALRQALTSPEFENEYRPLLLAAVKRATAEAWRAPATRDALAELARVARPTINHFTADTLRPVMLERLQPALWATVKDNTAKLLDVFGGFQLDFRQMERALTQALTEPRVLAEAEDAFGLVAGTPQMRTLVETFAVELTDRLGRDRELAEGLGRMMSDGRLARHLSVIGEPGLTLARTTPRALAQLDEKADLNSLAADIFKSQARGFSGHVVVFMSPDDRRRMQAIDPLTVTLLAGEPVR